MTAPSRTVVQSVLYLVGSQVVVGAFTIASQAMINRILGPSARGDYAELISWAAVLSSVFGLSAPIVAFHFAVRDEHGHLAPELFGTVLAAWAVTTLVMAAGAWAVSGPFSLHPGSANLQSHMLPVALLTSAAMGVLSYDVLLKIAGAFRAVVVLTGASSAIFLAGVVVLAATHHLGLNSLLGLLAASQLLAIAAEHAYLSRLVGFRELHHADAGLLGRMLAAGLKMHTGTVAALLYVRVDQIMVYNLAGSEQAGQYAVAVTIALQTMVLPMAIQQVLYSRVVQVLPPQDALLSGRVVRLAAILFGIALVGVWLLAGPIVSIYAGPDYALSTVALRILVPGIAFFSVASLIAPYCVKKGFFALGSVAASLTLAVNMGLNVWWIPRWGAVGASAATDVTYLFGMVLAVLLFGYLSGQNGFTILRFGRGDFTALAGAARQALTFLRRPGGPPRPAPAR